MWRLFQNILKQYSKTTEKILKDGVGIENSPHENNSFSYV